MKKAILILSLALVAMICKVNEQKQIISNLSTQATEQHRAFTALLDRIEQDNPNYVCDILSETDAYCNYIEVIKY